MQGGILVLSYVNSCHLVVTKFSLSIPFGLVIKLKIKKIKIIQKDIRYLKEKEFPKNIHSVLHLAAISNDPSAELDPKLSWDVNVLGLLNILNLSAKKQVKNLFLHHLEVFMVLKKKKKSRKFIFTTNK